MNKLKYYKKEKVIYLLMVMIYIRYWKLRKKIIPMLFQKWLRMKNVIIVENFSYAILLLPLFNILFHALLLISSNIWPHLIYLIWFILKIRKLINMVMLLNMKRILMQTEMKSILLKNFRMILLINLLDRVKIWQLISFICMIFNFCKESIKLIM